MMKFYQRSGGNGVIVEINESKFRKRRYYKGNCVNGVWVLGMAERERGKIRLVKVFKRDKETLLPLIRQYVCEKLIFITDRWRAYNCLGEYYIHYVVNHSLSFVDPNSGRHTNTIEGHWAGIKGNNPKSNRT